MLRSFENPGISVENPHEVWKSLVEKEEKLKGEDTSLRYDHDSWLIEDSYEKLKEALSNEVVLKLEYDEDPQFVFDGIPPLEELKMDIYDEALRIETTEYLDNLVKEARKCLGDEGVKIKHYQFLLDGGKVGDPQQIIRDIENGNYILEIQTQGPRYPSGDRATIQGISFDGEERRIDPFIMKDGYNHIPRDVEFHGPWEVPYEVMPESLKFEASDDYLDRRGRKLRNAVSQMEI